MMFKSLFTVLYFIIFYISVAQAKLPDINKNNLISAIQFADSLQTNIDIKYTVDEQFNETIHGDIMPEKRQLKMQWRREGIRDYYDVTVHDGKYIRGKPFRVVTAFNGEHRKQWMPNENKGDVFKEPYKSSWPIPIDFGLTLGKHDKKLGKSLEECHIEALENANWAGHECYYMKAIQPNGAKAEVWIDPKIGWRARNVKLYRTDGLIMYEATADFNDLGNGIYFPVEGIAKLYGKDPNTGERIVSCIRKLKIEEVKVNADLTQEDFNIKFPKDTDVYDHIYGIGYVVGLTSLDGIDDAALNDIVRVAKTKKVSVVDSSIGPLEDEIGGTTAEKAANTSETIKTNSGSKIADKDYPIGSVRDKAKPRLWWLIALLMAGVLCAVLTVSRREKT